MRAAAPAEFPGDEESDAITRALNTLALAPTAVDPGAVCAAPRLPPKRAPDPSPSCAAPTEHWLHDPLLRDARRERSESELRSPDYYQDAIAKLEAGLSRSRPKTHARRKILSWLTTAYDRLRRSRSDAADEDRERTGRCLVFYLEQLSREPAPDARRSRKSGILYTIAVELELLGERKRALALYRRIAASAPFGAGFAGAHAALGDAAHRKSFCDDSKLALAHRHYLIAAQVRSPNGAPLAGYARVRLAQIEQALGALGPAGRQLQLAEQDFGGFSRSYLGPERRRLGKLARNTLRQNLWHALEDGTLRLVLAYAPAGGGVCTQLLQLGLQQRDPRARDQIEAALLAHCSWMKATTRREGGVQP